MYHGTRTLQALCQRGGQASQEDLAKDVGLSLERLGPVLAGLHHNGYLLRVFLPGGNAQISVTDDGRRWTSLRGTVSAGMPSNSQPQAGPKPPRHGAAPPPAQPLQRPQPTPQSRQSRMAAVTPQQAPQAPLAPQPPRSLQGRLQLTPRSQPSQVQPPPVAVAPMAPIARPTPPAPVPPPVFVAPPPVAPPAPAQPVASAPAAAEPVVVEKTEGVAASTTASEEPARRRPGRPRKIVTEERAPVGEAPKRGRPRRKPYEQPGVEEGEEVLTDESGFVTHIKGRRIF